ncbi:MAG: FKBP-type peptidyl-prolyl cis-trans isomerase, partial [Chlamydiia bacterium]|nr:FKBP-type peptidyl-prolyl cis-trans isomerase [Chlamydiia bacterium]
HNFFQQAKTLPHVETLIPNRLCISTLKQTDSPKVISPTSKTIKIHYHVKDAKGKIINGTFTDTQPLEANLAELIPGLAHGLSGMKEGEVREIYIHPDLAYGTYSEFANGKPFTVHIKLVEINGNTHKPLPPLRPVDTEHLSPNIDSCNSFTTLQKKYSFYCGYKTWLHYKKASPHLNLNTIIKELLQTQSIPQTEQEKEDLAMLNWLIYHDKLDTHYSKAENKS